MHSQLSRRSVVAAVGSVLISGCLSSSFTSASGSCEKGTVRIRTQEDSNFESQDSSVEPLSFDELPEPEQQLLHMAIQDGEYVECYPGPDSFQSFVDRAHEHLEQQQEPTLHLRYHGDVYQLSVYVLDEGVP